MTSFCLWSKFIKYVLQFINLILNFLIVTFIMQMKMKCIKFINEIIDKNSTFAIPLLRLLADKRKIIFIYPLLNKS